MSVSPENLTQRVAIYGVLQVGVGFQPFIIWQTFLPHIYSVNSFHTNNVIFKEFWTCFLTVSIKITCYYFSCWKIAINMWKTHKNDVLLHVFGMIFDVFSNWNQRFDSIFEELSYVVFRLEKFILLPEIFRKNWKILTSIKLISRKLWHGLFSNELHLA